jgi:uracil-DNA glycosylase
MILWSEAIKDFMAQPDMVELKRKVTELRKTKNIFPKAEEVYNAFKLCPYENIKVIIIGQDPYPTEGNAHGLSFSCLKKETPASLLNIFKELQRSVYPSLKIEDLFKSNDLTSWAQQGVLLLNTILTVEEGQANSHKGFGWEKLTERVISLLNTHERPLVFMLWGNNAKELKPLITDPKHLILESSHPSPLSVDKGFFGCNHFNQANDFIFYNNEKFVKLDDSVDFVKAKKILKEKMQNMGCKLEDYKKQKLEIEKTEVWARQCLGLWIDEVEQEKAWKERIDWTIKK